MWVDTIDVPIQFQLGTSINNALFIDTGVSIACGYLVTFEVRLQLYVFKDQIELTDIYTLIFWNIISEIFANRSSHLGIEHI